MNGIVMPFLSWLLQRANAKPPAMTREAFFAMKDRLLRRYGQAVGTDLQHIALKCWSCDLSVPYSSGRALKPYLCHNNTEGLALGKCVLPSQIEFRGCRSPDLRIAISQPVHASRPAPHNGSHQNTSPQ